MNRLHKYVKDDNGHINEQIEKNTGKQTAAHDLTWSYANILTAIKERKTTISLLANTSGININNNVQHNRSSSHILTHHQ